MSQFKIAYRSIVAAAVILFATGCATNTEEMSELRSLAQEAQQTAERAQSRAERAESRASEASQKADEALRKANEAQTCCETNRQRMERMFEKSQQK